MKKKNPKKLTLQEITNVYVLLGKPKSNISEYGLATNLYHRSVLDAKNLFYELYGIPCKTLSMKSICLGISFALIANKFIDFCKKVEQYNG